MIKRWGNLKRGERGFTLLELLVVLLIIAILAAIAIPLFIRQRDKARVAQSQSLLANAKLIAEAYYTGHNASYVGLDDATIQDEGLPPASNISLVITADQDSYCIAAIHFELPAETNPDLDWKVATVGDRSKGPSPMNTCPAS